MATQPHSFEQQVRPLAEQLIAYAMKVGKKYGVTDAEVVLSTSDDLELSVEKGVLVNSESGLTQKVHMTLYAGSRIVYFSNNNLDIEALKHTIREQVKVIRFIPENPYATLLPSADIYRGAVADLNLFDDAVATTEQMFNYARDIEIAALAQPEIKGTRKTVFSRELSESFVLATNGLSMTTKGTKYIAGIEVIAERDGQMQAADESVRVRHFSDLIYPEIIGEKAAESAVAKLGSTTPKTMKDIPVVFNQEAASDYFEILYEAMDGENVYKGTTFLKDKLGEKVVSSEITLLDDPLVVKGLESQVCDGSGMQSRPIQFIENGVLREYISDLEQSRKLGRAPIGRNEGQTNAIIQPGPRSVYTLIKDIKRGVYVTGFNGGQADVNTGKHSREAYGHLIVNGEITRKPISGFAVSGDLKDMFNNTLLANDTPPMPNPKASFVAPTTRVNGLTIAGV